jgi:hypothetical protein
MNLRYEITPDRPDQIPQVTARIQAANRELRGLIQAAVHSAVEAGRGIAESEAPEGERGGFDDGVAIRDAIRTSEIRYAPGGSGGGGFYEVDLYVDSAIAPQVEFVMEGTADEGREKIYPSAGNLSGVLAIEKKGEPVHFRMWSHGQAPQTLWWDHAHAEIERVLEAEIDNIQ